MPLCPRGYRRSSARIASSNFLRSLYIRYATATLGARHADTLRAQAYLGDTRLNLGDAAGAVALLEVVMHK